MAAFLVFYVIPKLVIWSVSEKSYTSFIRTMHFANALTVMSLV